MQVNKTNNDSQSFGMKFPGINSQEWCLDKKALEALPDLLSRPDGCFLSVGLDCSKIRPEKFINNFRVFADGTQDLIFEKKVLASNSHKLIKYLSSDAFLQIIRKRLEKAEIQKINAQMAESDRVKIIKDLKDVSESANELQSFFSHE